MYKIIITDPASNDINNAVSYIAGNLFNKSAALELLDETDRVIKSLAEMPGRIPLVNDSMLAAQGVRMVQIKNYLAFFVIREKSKSITVLRFLHARRNWKNLLKNEYKRIGRNY